MCSGTFWPPLLGNTTCSVFELAYKEFALLCFLGYKWQAQSVLERQVAICILTALVSACLEKGKNDTQSAGWVETTGYLSLK